MVYVITAIIVIILLVVGNKMSKDQGYTIGKGMFKIVNIISMKIMKNQRTQVTLTIGIRANLNKHRI